MTDKLLESEPTQFAPDSAEQSASVPQAAKGQHTPDSSYQSYLFGGAGSDEHPAWSDSAKGRAAIRLISRGIVGAAFFTIGGRMATQHLKGYNQNAHWGETGNDGKWLQYIAKGIDSTLGRGIQKTVTKFAEIKYGAGEVADNIGRNAVTFRDTHHYAGSGFDKGRSYGADIVGFTFDFAAASVGDALTRNVIQALDPNVKKSWRVNDEGKPAVQGEKWHFLPGEFLKWSGNTVARIFTKNQGEDWAAAIPYAFQMKFQRQALNKAFGGRWKGHEVQFDEGWNGGAFRVETSKISPQSPPRVISDMQLVGAIDLHLRFTGYNWYTLMYREGHDAIGNAWNQWKDNGFKVDLKLPEHFNPITATVDGVGHTARYVTKSFIKANMFMNPAVIPFWMMRVPQSKRRDRFIADGAHVPTPANLQDNFQPFHDATYDNWKPNTRFDRFERGFSQTLNPLGKFSNWLGGKAANASDKLVGKGMWPKNEWLNKIVEQGDRRRSFMHNYVDASLSYTPYMWAKAETTLRVDDRKADGSPGQMDLAIYKFMDDVARFKFHQVSGDLKKMWKLGTNFERTVKAREGAEPDAQEIVQAPITPARPTTLVQASSIEQTQGQQLRSAPSANDSDYHEDKKWAQMVSGSDINAARFHSASPTRH